MPCSARRHNRHHPDLVTMLIQPGETLPPETITIV
jgi:hypothetical protein